MFYFYPQTQAPGSTGLSESGTPAQSGYLTSDGSVLSFVKASGDAQPLAGTGAPKMLLTMPAKNPSAVGMLAGGFVVPGDCTITRVRLAVGTLPTSAGDAFSFNLYGSSGAMFVVASTWAREVDVTGFAKSLDSGATFTDYRTEVTGSGTANLAIDTLLNGDAFYAGYSDLFAGVRLDMDGSNVNAVNATLAAHYWDGSAWQALTITDGTVSTGKTLAQDGAVTWVPPSDWAARELGSLGSKYWVRFSVSAAMTAGTAVDNADIIRAVNHGYAFTPDQNTTLSQGDEIRLQCTEADSNAAGLVLQIEGVFT